ncbi:hypothetical protein JCM3770_004794 [Rhodotorula araucariae]
MDAELPTVLQDLVPLSYLVDRVVAAAYLDLATLVETLPSHADQARKRAIVDYVLHTRRQLLKLLVLTRWSTEADRVHKAMNIVAFLATQNHAVDASVHALQDTAHSLAQARVRNYDLDTALAVLTSGTYPAVPAKLAHRFTNAQAAPLDDDAVLRTLQDVDQVLRWRLVMRREHVPPAMARVPWRIQDGRVVFTVPGLWQATLTYSGGIADDDEGQEGAEWFLLGVMFLFRVSDARGSWSATPAGPLKEHLVDLCNRELLRRPYLPPADPAEGAPAPPPPATNEADELKAADVEPAEASEARRANERAELVRKRRRDRPLDRAYTFLQRLALSYQLEAVYASAARLAATTWNGNLRVDISPERDEVRVEYWTADPPVLASGQRPAPTATAARAAGPGGALVFSFHPQSSTSTAGGPARPTAVAVREHALQAALAATASSASSSSSSSTSAATPGASAQPLGVSTSPAPAPASASAAPVPAALCIAWHPHHPAAVAPPGLELGSDLDVAALLDRVVRAHAAAVVHRLAEVVGEAEPRVQVVYAPAPARARAGDEGKETDEDEDEDEADRAGEPYLRIPLLGAQALEAHVAPRTGRFELRIATSTGAGAGPDADADADEGEGDGEGVGGTRAARLRTAAERVNRERFAPVPAPPVAASAAAATQPQDGEGWMRGVPEVVARIRASTILDDLDTLVALVALPRAGSSTRRLPLPARELAKLGPNPAFAQGRAALLFVPVLSSSGTAAVAGAGAGAGAGADKWALALVLFDEGVRAALVRARESTDGMNTFWELVEVGWLGPAAGPGVQDKGKGREGAGRGANLGYEVGGETLRGLWAQCLHRVALFELEQQLASRRIAYRLAPPAAPCDDALLLPGAPARPCLLVDGAALVRLPDVERVLGREAALQCVLDGEGRVRTTLHARFRVPLPSSALPNPADLPQNVLWNPKRGVMVFAVEDDVEGDAVERLLRAYAMAVRTVLAAQRAAAIAAAAASTSASDPATTAPPASPSKKLARAPVGHVRGLPNGLGV